jgi:hypothetical protein
MPSGITCNATICVQKGEVGVAAASLCEKSLAVRGTSEEVLGAGMRRCGDRVPTRGVGFAILGGFSRRVIPPRRAG